MSHMCPACSKGWECECTQEVKDSHIRVFMRHPREIACSVKCAYHLYALENYLRSRGF